MGYRASTFVRPPIPDPPLPNDAVDARLAPFQVASRMKRLATAPNIAIATLWADMLSGSGVATSVQRYYAGSIAGEIPPDQALPELWIDDAAQFEHARRLLHELRHPRHRRWRCAGCSGAHKRLFTPSTVTTTFLRTLASQGRGA